MSALDVDFNKSVSIKAIGLCLKLPCLKCRIVEINGKINGWNKIILNLKYKFMLINKSMGSKPVICEIVLCIHDIPFTFTYMSSYEESHPVFSYTKTSITISIIKNDSFE